MREALAWLPDLPTILKAAAITCLLFVLTEAWKELRASLRD